MRSLAILILALTASQGWAHVAVKDQHPNRYYLSEDNLTIKDGKIYLKDGNSQRRLHCLYSDRHGLYIPKALITSKWTMPCDHTRYRSRRSQHCPDPSR